MSDFNGLCYFENLDNIVDLNCNHALQAMVLQLPADGAAWTPEQRANWMRAFDAVLDFAHPDSVMQPPPSLNEILEQMRTRPGIKTVPADPQAPPLANLIEKAGVHTHQEAEQDNFESNYLDADRKFGPLGIYRDARDAAKVIRRMIRKADNKPAQIVCRRTDGRIRVCTPGYVPEENEIDIGTFDYSISLNDLCGEIREAIAG